MKNSKAVILAAGKGTRMKSELPKVLHKVQEKTMVEHVIDAVRKAGIEDICLVVGHKAELVKETVGNGVVYVEQESQLGTGHAVMCAADFIGTEGDTIILCGDTPLITADTLQQFMQYHKEEENKATVLSTILEDSTGYGRIIREEDGGLEKIVEEKDASLEERKVKEVNSGMYVFSSKDLSESLGKLTNNNAQKEYYLTDTLEIIKNEGGKTGAWITPNADEIRGVNTIEQLKEAEEILNKR